MSIEAEKLLVDALTEAHLVKNYRISAQMSFEHKRTDIIAEIHGNSFDIRMPDMWFKSVNGEHWISRDDGNTWKTTEPDSYLVAVLQAPIGAQVGGLVGGLRARVEEVDQTETKAGVVVHLRVVPVVEFDPGKTTLLPEYWVLKTPQGVILQKFIGPIWFFSERVMQRAEYSRHGQIREISRPKAASALRKE